jgi:hypothetical protein
VLDAGGFESGLDFEEDGFSSVSPDGIVGIASGSECGSIGGGGSSKPFDDSLSAWGFKGGKEIGEEVFPCGGNFFRGFCGMGFHG